MKEEEKQFSIDAIVKQTVLESFKAAEKDLDDKLNKTLETIETVKQELSEKVKDLLIDSIGTDGKDGEKGDKGDKGEQGEKGEDGKDGKDGIDGIDGVDGQRGPAPKHRWKGTALAFQNPDGSWGKEVDLKGKDGSDGRSSLFGRGASSLSIYRNGAVFTTGAINFIGGTITGDQNIMNIDLSASGGGSWGSITGTLSDQTDLQTALNAITPNATHTGDVTGATALTIDKTAITGKTAVTAVGADYVLISDTSDSGNLKKALASDFGGVWTRTGTDLAPTTSGDSVTMSGRFHDDKGADITAAGDITLGTDGNYFVITGNTTINAILTTGWQAGSMVALEFTGTPTVSNNTAGGASTAKIMLDGQANMAAVNGTVLTLRYNGTVWAEVGRSFTGA